MLKRLNSWWGWATRLNELEIWEVGVRVRCLIVEDVVNGNNKIKVVVSFGSHLLISLKKISTWDTCLAQLVQHETLDLRIVSSSPMLERDYLKIKP